MLSVLCGIVFAQNKTSINDTVIALQEISVYSKDGLELLQSNNKKGEIHISVKGKSSFVDISVMLTGRKLVYHL